MLHNTKFKVCFTFILLLCCNNVTYSQLDTLFWFVAPEITQSHGDRPIVFRFATLNKPAVVTISQPANPNFPTQILDISANSSKSLDLTPWIDIVENKPANTNLNYGFKITSNVQITAYYEVVTACNCNPDIFTLKGKNSLGKNFITPFQNFLDNASYARSGFNIVATEDNTEITITPTKDIVGHLANVPFKIVLNKGQTYFAEASGTASGAHLSGSSIVATKKIAVTLHDDTASGAPYGGCADLMGDQLIPIPVLGKEYIAIKGYLNGPDKVYIVAVNNNTQINIDGNNVGSINKGAMYVHTLSNPTAYIKGSDSVCVLHQSGFGCEVGEAVLPHIVCTGSNIVPFVRSTNEFIAMNILAPAGAEDGFTFNGQTGIINASSFKFVPASNNSWMYAQLDISSNMSALQGARVENLKSKFHMGIIHGGSSSGCRYGYFSDFGSLKYEINPNKTSLCEGDTLKLSSSVFMNATYDWKGPNNFTFKGPNLIFQSCNLSNAGLYQVSGFQPNTCIIVADSINVKVLKNDSIVKNEIKTICSSTLPFKWHNQTLTKSGVYKIKILNSTFCIDTIIYLNLTVNLIKAGSDLKICQGASVKLNASGGVSYQWDNNVMNGVNFSPTKSARYTVTGTDANGCKDTSSLFILVNPLPSVNAGNDTNVCVGTPAILKGKGALSYSWNNGVENSKPFYPTVKTSYEVTGTDLNGCKNTDQVEITLNSNPTIKVPLSTLICFKDSFQMLASGALTFTWNNGVVNGTKIMPPIGKNKYNVEGKDVNNCSAKDSLIITVLEPIKLNSVIKDVLCFGKSTGEINNTVVGEVPLNFSWNNGAKTKDLLNVTAASYSLKITDANGCEKDTSYTIKQPLAPLSVSIKNTPVSCYNDKNGILLATVTGGTKPYNYLWDTGQTDSILTELSDGTYTLKAKDQNQCEISISSTITHLYELPIVNAGKDEQFCFGETLKLNAIGASSYVWSNGQANGSDIKPEVGNFSYSVIGTDTHGCIGKDTIKASVFELPSFQEMKIQPIACYGETNGSVSISLASGKAPYTYLWSNGITDQNLTKVGAGKYKLKVLDANSCLVEISFTITQPKAPMISSLNAVDNVCDRDSSGIITSTVEGGTAPYSFSWNTTKTTSGISGLAVGEYWVKITDKNGCENFHQKNITALHARPFVDAGNSKTICYGDTVLIKGSGAKEYTWQDGFKDSSYIKFGIGSQLIRVTGKDQYGCINSDTVRYTIVPIPIIKAGNAIQACKQIPITLLATGGLIHTWDKEVQNGIPFVAPVGENYYHVNAIDGYGCKGKDSVLVTIYEYPEVNFSSDITTGCIPLKIHFEDESAIKSNQVEWIFGTEHSTKTGNASYTFLETGCYTISLSSTLNKCTSTKTKKNHICVIDKPKASFTVSSYTLPLLEPHIELINLSQNGTNYHWNFGDGDTSSLFHTSHTYPGQANIYTIELIVNNGLKNCEDKHTEVITIQDELILYVPNTFTPNGDEHNNEFTPIFSSGFDPNYYLFQVFDRWNILLFESNNSTIGWSGSYHNQPSKSDTYTWIIHYKEKNLQKEHIIKGHVNLIR